MDNAIKKIDSYDIIRKLGQGGMADVYLAHDESGEEVAIKVIKREFAALARYVKRFQRECRAVSGLRHPNIIRLFGYGTHEGHPYAVMEYLPGDSLQDRLDEKKKLTSQEVLAMAAPLLEAMAYYGAKGLVHRDLKPSNIIFNSDGKPVIVDFGLVYDADLTAMTQAGQLVGTPAYIAPEILRGESASLKSDIYQLGVILFECLSGELPFLAPTPALVMTCILQGRAQSLKKLEPNLDKNIVAFINRMMASNVDERYQSAEEALHDLTLLSSGKQLVTEAPKPLPSAPTPTLKAKAYSRRYLSLSLTILAFIVIALISAKKARNDLQAQIPKPRIAAGFEKVRVDWVSKKALRVRATLYDVNDAELLSRSDPGATLNHSFILPIDRRRNNIRMRMRVLPDGPVSFPIAVRTNRLPKLDIQNVQFSEEGLTIALLTEKEIPEVDYKVIVRNTSGRLSAAKCKAKGRQLFAAYGDTGADVAQLSCKIRFRPTKEETTVNLDSSFQRWATRYYDKCKNLSFSQIMASMLTKAVAELVNNAGRDLKAVTSEGIVEKKGWEKLDAEQKSKLQSRLDGIKNWSRQQKWGSLILDIAGHQDVLLSSPLIPLKQQSVFFESALGAVGIDAGFLARNWPSFTDRTYSFGRTWSFSWRWAPPSGGGWFRQFSKELSPKDAKMKAVDLALVVIGKKKENRNFRFNLSHRELNRIKRCILCLEVRSIPNRLYLDAHVNSRPRFLVSGVRREEGAWFCQNFPAELLRIGTNKIEVTVNLVSAFFREKSPAVLKSVVLLVEH
jgi:serine/threonine protein kinase